MSYLREGHEVGQCSHVSLVSGSQQDVGNECRANLGKKRRLIVLHDAPPRVHLVFERVAHALFPTLLLQNTPWYTTWMEQERRESVFLWRLFFPIVATRLHWTLLPL